MNTSDSEKICHQWLYDLVDTNSTNLEELNEAFKKRHIGGIIFILCLIFIGIIGNIHVLWIYIRLFRPSNYRTYVLCLAALDIANCTIGMPLTVVYLNYPLMYPSDAFCKVYRFCLYYVSITSAMIFVIIAIDRYVKICCPIKRHLTNRETIGVCVLGQIIGLVLSWPSPFLYGLIDINFPGIAITGHRCFTADNLKDLPYQKIYSAVLTLVFAVILILIIVLYYFVIKAVREHTEFQSKMREKPGSRNDLTKCGNEGPKSSRYQKVLRRTTVTLLLVTVAFIASSLPHHILAVSLFTIPNFECTMGLDGGIAYYTFVWIFMVNNVINPIIYSFSDKKFRFHMKRMYTQCSSQKDSRPAGSFSESKTFTIESRA